MDERTFYYTDRGLYMSLKAIKVIAALNKQQVPLFDNQGFRKGTVYPDGTVTQ